MLTKVTLKNTVGGEPGEVNPEHPPVPSHSSSNSDREEFNQDKFFESKGAKMHKLPTYKEKENRTQEVLCDEMYNFEQQKYKVPNTKLKAYFNRNYK